MTFNVVITGASSGIGRAIALLSAKRGHSITLIARNKNRLTEVANLCKSAGANDVQTIISDISTTNSTIKTTFQNNDEIVLINNAGCAAFGEFHEIPIAMSIQQVDTMLSGLMRTTHAFLPTMLAQHRGTIVNVLSIAATTVFPNSEAYSAAKAGALAFSKCLSKSYSERGIRVISLIIGATNTPLWDGIGWSPPKEDMLTPEEVAQKVLQVIENKDDRTYQEIQILPAKGIL